MLLTLVVGPFLILLIFGLGYREDPPPFRTLLVLENEQAQLAADQEDLGEAFGGGIILEGTSTDVDAARRSLANGEVDLLIIAPEDPLSSIESGEKAMFHVVHGEVDPVLRANIGLLARLSVNEINRRVLSEVVTTAQARSEVAEDPLQGLRTASSQLVSALESGDRESATDDIAVVRDELNAARAADGGGGGLHESVTRALGSGDRQVYAELEEGLENAESDDIDTALEGARQVETAVAELETVLGRAQELDPDVLVSPFGAEVEQVNDVPTEPGIFYSPGTLVVLLQHLAVTFAALSLVRERQLGLTEVFRASPLGPGEAVTGKYLGFGILSLSVAAVLTAVMLGFGVEIRGSVAMYVTVVVLLVIAALGLGFLLSGLSKTDTQAVQYAMITLLLSIFFTGFVLPLDQLVTPVQIISYLIPATYGIRALHDVVFRGTEVEPAVLAGLVVYALAMAVAAWWVVRRDVAVTANGQSR